MRITETAQKSNQIKNPYQMTHEITNAEETAQITPIAKSIQWGLHRINPNPHDQTMVFGWSKIQILFGHRIPERKHERGTHHQW